MKIAVIDFETANHHRASACSIGVAVIEGGEITERYERLIRPPKGYGWFRSDFIEIHGITHEDVKNAEDFYQIFQEIRDCFDGAFLAAHNAVFDMGVLFALLRRHGLLFSCEYFCTLAASRAVWPELPRHDLCTIARHLGIGLQHHRAGSDALVTAQVTLAMLRDDRFRRLEMIAGLLRPFSV